MAICCKVYRKEICHNSLEWAKEHIDDAPDGSIFLADHHEVTRGRQDRTWIQYKGQLLITILLKPNVIHELSFDELPIRLNQLNMALSLGINEVLKSYGSVIKWPNDFSINGKKIGGMLMEVIWAGDRPKGMVLGFALNVNTIFMPDDDLFEWATSLEIATGSSVDKDSLLNSLCSSLDRYYERWQNKEFNELFKEWRNSQNYIGRELSVHKKDGSITQGIMSDVFENGDMVIDCDGKKKIIPFFVVDSIIPKT